MTISLKIAVVGSHRTRVSKVLSLLKTRKQSSTTTNIQELQLQSPTSSIEYIACVATFDSYQDEDGKAHRYLAKLEYHDDNGSVPKGLSLAQFFDEYHQSSPSKHANNEQNTLDRKATVECDINKIYIPGIAAFVIGCGIELTDDVQKITSFLETMMANNCTIYDMHSYSQSPIIHNQTTLKSDEHVPSVLVQCIQPNDEYKTMTEENQVYKNLSPEEKEYATKMQTIGPGKMAKFATYVSYLIVTHHCSKASLKLDSGNDHSLEPSYDHHTTPTIDNDTTILNKNLIIINEGNETEEHKTTSISSVDEALISHKDEPLLDPTQTRYACKMCRTKLFANCHLEDPPHPIGKHGFSSRKQKGSNHRGGGSSSDPCHSYFLASALDWMADISSSVEGKLNCPKCNAKLGLYNWTGSQCSCGTWVVPAIQIQKGRVDVMHPFPLNQTHAS